MSKVIAASIDTELHSRIQDLRRYYGVTSVSALVEGLLKDLLYELDHDTEYHEKKAKSEETMRTLTQRLKERFQTR